MSWRQAFELDNPADLPPWTAALVTTINNAAVGGFGDLTERAVSDITDLLDATFGQGYHGERPTRDQLEAFFTGVYQEVIENALNAWE